jgi:hypothetical protein
MDDAQLRLQDSANDAIKQTGFDELTCYSLIAGL